MRRLRATAVVAIALGALLPAVAAAQSVLHVRTATDAAQTWADNRACARQAAEAAPSGPNSSGAVSGALAGSGAGLLGALLGGLIVGTMEARERSSTVAHVLELCLEDRGYAPLTLTDAESREFRGLRDDAPREAWLTDWMARPEVQARISAAAEPVNAPLPDVPDAPFAVAGLQIDPSTVRLQADPMSGRTVVVMQARYRAVARLRADFIMEGGARPRISAGALMHGRRGGKTGAAPIWCGPLTTGSGAGAAGATRCFVRTTRGYRLTAVRSGTGWLEEGIDQPRDFVPGAMELDPVDAASGPTFPVELRLGDVTGDSVRFTAVALRDGQEVPFWTREVPYRDGMVALPFWTRRLVLTRRPGRGVGIALRNDGNSAGWDGDLDSTPSSAPG